MQQNSINSYVKPELPDFKFHWEKSIEPITPEELNFFFDSQEIVKEKELICDMGRRMWQRNFVDGNGGNISVRVSKNLVLCSPTLISKGFMKIDDVCLVDMTGCQKAGKRPATSEILTHLAIYQNNEAAGACVHAHPPHATTFSISEIQPPTALLPEVEIFLGEIAVAPYRHPGSPEMGSLVGTLAQKHQAILMQNHGAITWGAHLEDAYWKMENLDTYCQMVLLAMSARLSFSTISEENLERLKVVRTSFNGFNP